jgi:hypothetical protein
MSGSQRPLCLNNRPFPWQRPSPLSNPLLFVIPTGANPDFLPRSARQSHVCAFLLRERRMKSANATNTYRKSGVAKGRDLRCAIRVPLIYRPTTSTNHHRIHIETSTSPLSFRVSRKDPRNWRSLAFPPNEHGLTSAVPLELDQNGRPPTGTPDPLR